jgi:hypothetical protein
MRPKTQRRESLNSGHQSLEFINARRLEVDTPEMAGDS